MLRSLTPEKSLVILSGPAIKIAKDLKIRFFEGQKNVEWGKLEFVVVGSSYPRPPKLHDQLLRKAKEESVFTIGILDGWENFSIRWPLALPDQIWVMDEYALELARKQFPSTEIHQVRNDYLEFLSSNLPKKRASNRNKNDILFLDSPRKSKFDVLHSEHKEHCICFILTRITESFMPKRILVRNHPLTKSYKCVEKLKPELVNCEVVISKSVHLYQDLQVSDVVVGKPTYALFAAQELGYSCYSTDQLEELPAPRFKELLFNS